MGIIGIIVFGIFGFIFLGVLGWIIKIFGYVFDFLLDGCFQSLGCLIWIVIIFLVLICLI
jgi:hypothetical protein